MAVMQREPNSSLPYHPDRLKVREAGFEPATDGVSHHAKRRRITMKHIRGNGDGGQGASKNPAHWRAPGSLSRDRTAAIFC